MKEKSIYYENIYSTTITKISTQNISVKTFNKDKIHITVILSILSDGKKIPPMILYEKNKTKEKK